MSVLRMSPLVLTDDWSDFIGWMARTFDMPVACRFDEEGWGRLAASSPGITVIKEDVFVETRGGKDTVVELQVPNVKTAMRRAVDGGATLVKEAWEFSEGQWYAVIETPHGVTVNLYADGRRADDTGVVNQGPVNFTVYRDVDVPIERAFEAVTSAADLTQFFVDDCDRDFADGEDVVWTWDEYGDGTLHDIELRANEFLAFHWRGHATSYNTRTQFTFSRVSGKTRVSITESGWNPDDAGLRSAFTHCEGWTTFLGNLKVWLENELPSM